MSGLQKWYEEYEKIAKEKGVEWICTGDPEDYQDAYYDYEPLEYLLEELQVASMQ